MTISAIYLCREVTAFSITRHDIRYAILLTYSLKITLHKKKGLSLFLLGWRKVPLRDGIQ